MSNWKTENGRRATFTNYPVSAAVKPKDLAAAGFYYLGDGDAVKCAYDGCELGDWTPEDDPMKEHATHFPECSFVAGKNRSSNVADACTPGRQSNWTPVTPSSNVADACSSGRQSNWTPVIPSVPTKELYTAPGRSAGPESLNLSLSREFETVPREYERAPETIPSMSSTASSFGQRSVSREEEVQAYMDTDVMQMLIHEKEYKQSLLSTICESFITGSGKLPRADKIVEAYWQLDEMEQSAPPPAQTSVKMTSPPQTQSMGGIRNPETMELSFTENGPESGGRATCPVCTSPIGRTAFTPCGHVVCCDVCAEEVDNCPLCLTEVIATRPAL